MIWILRSLGWRVLRWIMFWMKLKNESIRRFSELRKRWKLENRNRIKMMILKWKVKKLLVLLAIKKISYKVLQVHLQKQVIKWELTTFLLLLNQFMTTILKLFSKISFPKSNQNYFLQSYLSSFDKSKIKCITRWKWTSKITNFFSLVLLKFWHRDDILILPNS